CGASGGNTLPPSSAMDAAQAQQLGQALAHNQPYSGSMSSCGVACQYGVTLLQQPEPLIALAGGAEEHDPSGIKAVPAGLLSMTQQDLTNLGLDIIPIVGQVKGLTEAILGHDITGRPLPIWQRALNGLLFPSVLGEVGEAVSLVTRTATASAGLLGRTASVG